MSLHKHIPINRALSDFINEVYCQECGEVLGVGFTITMTYDSGGVEKKWELEKLPKEVTKKQKKVQGKVRKLSLSERLKLA